MSRTSTSKARSDLLQEVRIYSPERSVRTDISEVVDFIRASFPSLKINVKRSPLTSIKKANTEDAAIRLVQARVKDPTRRLQSFEPMFGEVEFERRAILGEANVGGIVYDGRLLEEIMIEFAGIGSPLTTASLVLTDRLVSTYSEDDVRHHLRTVVFGFPSIISLPGIVEAPAKPREYYMLKQALEAEGASELHFERLKSEFRDRFIDYDDARTTEVMKGLTLQAIMYHLTLEPFCRNKSCRFFNAHWQEELIEGQVTKGVLCEEHLRRVKSLGKNPRIGWTAR